MNEFQKNGTQMHLEETGSGLFFSASKLFNKIENKWGKSHIFLLLLNSLTWYYRWNIMEPRNQDVYMTINEYIGVSRRK